MDGDRQGSAPPRPRRHAAKSSGPRSEAAAGGGYGIKRANRFKRTKRYRGAVRAAYDAQPVAKRSAQQRVIERHNPRAAKAVYGLDTKRDSGPRGGNRPTDFKRAIKRLSPEDRALLHIHLTRMARNADLADDAARSPRMSTADRRRATRFATTPDYKQALADGHEAGLGRSFGETKAGHAARSGIAGLIPGLPKPVREKVGEIAVDLADAVRQDPKRTIVNTGKGVGYGITAIPAGIAQTAVHPLATAKSLGADYGHRYGTETSRQRVDRFIHEGAAPEVFDAASVAAVGGATVGRLAGAVARTDRAARIAPRVHRIATSPRPKLRVTGGQAVEQAVSPNLTVAGVQRLVDTRRTQKMGRQVKRSAKHLEGDRRGHGMPANVAAAVEANEAAGRVVEVTPQRIFRAQAKVHKAQRVMAAKAKGRVVQAMRGEHGRRIGAAARVLAKLNRSERRLFYWIGAGLVNSRDRVGLLKDLRDHQERILTGREQARAAGEPVAERTGLFSKSDDLENIQRIIRDFDKIDVDKVRLAKQSLEAQDLLVGRQDRGTNAAMRLTRRYAQQAETLGIRRGEIPHDGWREVGPDQARLRRIDARMEAIERELHPDGHVADDGAGGLSPHVIPAERHLAAGGERIPEERQLPRGAGHPVRRGEREALEGELRRLQAERRRHEGHVEQGPPGAAYTQEPLPDYIRRVQRAADERGMERPLYFPSEKYAIEHSPSSRADFAAGGKNFTRVPYRYTGKLFRTGTQDTSPQVYLQGLARSVKRRHNWALVERQMSDHVLPGMSGSLADLRHRLEAGGYDLHDVAFWNPRAYRELTNQVEEGDAARNLETAEYRRARFDEDGDTVLGDLNSALTGSTLKDIDGKVDAELRRDPSWVAIPRAAYDEIMSTTTPSGLVGRSYDIAKHKVSRWMLGTSPAWLQFQVVSNAMIGMAATGGRLPVALIRGQAWYRGLDEGEKQVVDSLLGAGMGADARNAPHLGATTDHWFVDGYRMFKEKVGGARLPGGHGPQLRQLNPIEIILGTDRLQNNVFRRAILHDDMRRAAFQGMERNMDLAQRAQSRISNFLQLDPEDRLRTMLRDPQQMERHAQHVDDWLGDYTTFTHKERTVIGRAVMFYPFLRYSLRLVFYTMPVKHPVIASIGAKLGSLQAEETRDLLGGDDLPYAFGKLYSGKAGERAIDFARANPALNALTQAKGPGQVLGVLPPYVGLAADQITGRSIYFDRGWRINNKGEQFSPSWVDSVDTRPRIIARQALRTFAPYRLLDDAQSVGPQGDDSLLGDRPTGHTNKDALAHDKRVIAFDKAHRDMFKYDLLPFLGRPNRDVEQAAEIRKRKQDDAKPAKGRAKKVSYGGSGAGGYGVKRAKGYGTSSGGGYKP